MDYIYNNKKIVLSLLTFIILFPVGLYGFRMNTSISSPMTDKTSNATPFPSVPSALLSKDDPQKKLLEYVQNKKPLSQSDARVKAMILGTLEGLPSGIVYQNTNITIEYTKSADMFQVEIMNSRVDAAKAEALLWFRDQGLSKEGICNIPVSFYLNHQISSALSEKEKSFNPLPPGC